MNVLCYLLHGGLWARESFCPRDKRHSVCAEILHLPDTFPHTFCELSFPSPLPLLCELWTALKICLWQTLSVLGQLSDKHEVKDFKYGIGLTNTHTHIERNSHHWLLLMSKHEKNNKTHQKNPKKIQGRECFYTSLRSCKQRSIFYGFHRITDRKGQVGKEHSGSPAPTSLITQGHPRSRFILCSKWNILCRPCTITKECCLLLQHQLNPRCKHDAVLRETKGCIPAGSSLRSGLEKPSLFKISPNRASGLEHTNDTNSLISFWLRERYFRSTRLQDS